MNVYLVRHAESQYNAEGRIQGQSDVPLSTLGLQQADALARAFRDVALDAVYSSPLRRALDTASRIASHHHLEVITDSRLMEINAGVFQGLRFEEMASQYPDAAARWAAGDPDFVIPGGESRRALMQRGKKALEDILNQPWQHVVVVAHGGLLSAALKGLLDIPAERNPFRFFNASISRLVKESQLKLLTLNQTEHLRDAGQPSERQPTEL